LITQAEVDDALDYYVSLYRDPFEMVELTMRVNYNIQKGQVIRVTSLKHDLNSRRFFVSEVAVKSNGRMTLTLLEATPKMALIIADMKKQTSRIEAEKVATDTVAESERFENEAIARTFVDVDWEIEYDSSVVANGKGVATDELLDDLIELIAGESPTQPTHLGYGTGIEPLSFDNIALDTETARVALTPTITEACYVSPNTVDYYRAVTLEIDVVNPSAVTEIGLLNAASDGTLQARAVFDSYSQTGTVTFRFTIRYLVAGEAMSMSWRGIKSLVDWTYNGAACNVTHIAHCGLSDFTQPDPCLVGAPNWQGFQYYNKTICPDDPADGTMTKSKFYDINRVKFKFVYPDYQRLDCSDDIAPEFAMIAVIGSWGNNSIWAYSHLRKGYRYVGGTSSDEGDFFENYCIWVMWFEFVQGRPVA